MPGDLIIPAALAERWERQIATPYAELSETEKDGDREQVDRYWPLIAALTAVAQAAVEWHAAMLGNEPGDIHGQAAWDRYEAAIVGLERAVEGLPADLRDALRREGR